MITAANGGPVFSDLWANCGEKSSISGMKFNDLDADGIKDLGEPGLNGWTIHLFNATGTVHLTQVTANGGKYSFTGLDDGTYTICEQVLVAIPPWQQTFPTARPRHCRLRPGGPAGPRGGQPDARPPRLHRHRHLRLHRRRLRLRTTGHRQGLRQRPARHQERRQVARRRR